MDAALFDESSFVNTIRALCYVKSWYLFPSSYKSIFQIAFNVWVSLITEFRSTET